MAKFKLSTKKNMKFIASDELYERFINKNSTLVKFTISSILIFIVQFLKSYIPKLADQHMIVL